MKRIVDNLNKTKNKLRERVRVLKEKIKEILTKVIFLTALLSPGDILLLPVQERINLTSDAQCIFCDIA